MYGEQDKIVPGNALTVAPRSPFGGLKTFGNNFLARLEGSLVNSPLMEKITLIDTPGVLSGAKQRLNRNYDFDKIVQCVLPPCLLPSQGSLLMLDMPSCHHVLCHYVML